MKPSRKQELKGAFKAIVAIAILGVMIGVGVATTLMSDDGFFVDGNEVLVEGDYTTWTLLWEHGLDDDLDDPTKISLHLDDVNGKLYLSYFDKSATTDYRFAIKNISDFSNVFLSPTGSHYVCRYPYIRLQEYERGYAQINYGGLSSSLYSYTLLLRADYKTIEVWRGGSSLLWSRDVTLDGVDTTTTDSGIISLTGKYIVIVAYSTATGKYALFCYEGS